VNVEGVAGRAVARLAKVLELAVAEADLSIPQYRMLILLADGSAAASELAGKLDVSPPSVTSLIDGLVARGLVERRPARDDRRRVDHLLTPKGLAVLGDADRAAAAELATVAGAAPSGRGRAALDALAVWEDAMNRYRDARMGQ
jgi:DNA-binding MarR family transcriptional regulator